MTVSFQPEGHVYRVAGEVYPSVTQVLCGEDLLPSYEWLSLFYRDRGSAVHRAIALDLLGLLDEASVDEVVRPFLDRWRAFAAAHHLEPLVVERPMACAVYRYAGTPDLLALMNGEPWLLDWKCGGYEPGHAIQVAGGYLPLLEQAAEAAEIPPDPDVVAKARIAVVSLAETPKLHPVERDGQRDLFRAALATYRWKQTYRPKGDG